MNKQTFSLTHLKLRIDEEVEAIIQDFELQEKSCNQNEILLRYVIASEVSSIVVAWKDRTKKLLEETYASFIEAIPSSAKKMEQDRGLLLSINKSKEVSTIKSDLLIVALQKRVGQKVTLKLIEEVTQEATILSEPRLSIKITQAFS